MSRVREECRRCRCRILHRAIAASRSIGRRRATAARRLHGGRERWRPTKWYGARASVQRPAREWRRGRKVPAQARAGGGRLASYRSLTAPGPAAARSSGGGNYVLLRRSIGGNYERNDSTSEKKREGDSQKGMCPEVGTSSWRAFSMIYELARETARGSASSSP